MTGSQSENYSHHSRCMVRFFPFSPKPGIFSLAAGVGHVVKARVIGSACPGLGSDSMRHAAAANEAAPADRNICMFSPWNGEGTFDFQVRVSEER